MTRIIKRYGSRKLYDTQESRYVLLEDIAAWVRSGEEIQVVDNKTAEDVTSQTLIQVISEEGRKKRGFLSSNLLHDLIRTGEGAVNKRVKQFQSGVDNLVKKSFDRFNPMSHVRDEMAQLRERLSQLETTLSEAESRSQAEAEKVEKPTTKKKPTRSAKTKSAPAAKTASGNSKSDSKTQTKSKTKRTPSAKPRAAKKAQPKKEVVS